MHGFIPVDEWERKIIDHPAFQRLRRIRQLGWTEYLYPGATHTRFEHSLGVMHIATRLYDSIVEHSKELLKSELGYNEDGLRRDRKLVRVAALLHDVGHGPFSHASEELMPLIPNSEKRYQHDVDYSSAIIRQQYKDIIEGNDNYGFKAEDVAELITGSIKVKKSSFWRDLITGQMDADRMDYLLRDSLHIGVRYGYFDLDRLMNTVVAVPIQQQNETTLPLRIGVQEGGLHAAESLILARYYMFTQVYFHRTRLAYDHHIGEAMKEMLPNGQFPEPTTEKLSGYLEWDDWKVLGLLSDGQGGEHGDRLRNRNHYREVYHTSEVPSKTELKELGVIRKKLENRIALERTPGKTWYTIDKADISVQMEIPGRPIRSLSECSSVVREIGKSNQIVLFTKPEQAEEVRKEIEELRKATKSRTR